MDESDSTSDDDPFADVAPAPEWDDPPDRDAVMAAAMRPSSPRVSADPVAPPPLPPPVGGPEDTGWSVQGGAHPELLGMVSAAPAETAEDVEAQESVDETPAEPDPPQVLPVDVPEAAVGTPAPFEFPPGFFGDQEPEPEPEPEPIIDLSTRDTAGLVTNIAGPLLWIAGLGAGWYLLTRGSDPIVAPQNWPTPSDTWEALRTLAEDEAARTSVRETVQRLLGALVAGGIVGLLVGSLTGRRRIVRNLLRPAVGVFRIVSPFVLLLFLFTWGGDAWWVEWAPAAVGVAALTAWSTDRALSNTKPRLTTISGPAVLRGIRASLILAWTLVFATEQALGLDGIFPAMAAATDTMPVAVAWLAIAAVIAMLADATLRLVEHLLARG